jgi:hypothetical protein
MDCVPEDASLEVQPLIEITTLLTIVPLPSITFGSVLVSGQCL